METLDEPPRSPSPSQTSPSPPVDPPDSRDNNEGSPSPPNEPFRPTPTSTTRRAPGGKRRKALSAKQRSAVERRLALLHHNLVPKPFLLSPDDLDAHAIEPLLRPLGLWSFFTTPLPSDIRRDILTELIAHYEPSNRRSSVKDARVNVSRGALAHALSLPVKRHGSAEPEEAERALLASGAAPLAQLIHRWIVLGDEGIVPDVARAAVDQVQSGQAWKVDWAGLLWGMVEKDLLEAPSSGVCYYASHLQQLVKHQKPGVFEQEEEEEEEKEKVEKEEEDEEEQEPLLELPDEEMPDAGDAAEGGIQDLPKVGDVEGVQEVAKLGDAEGIHGDIEGVQEVAEVGDEVERQQASVEEDGGGGVTRLVNVGGRMAWSDDAAEHGLRHCNSDHLPSMGYECKGEDDAPAPERVDDVGACGAELVVKFPSLDGTDDVVRDVDTRNDPFCPSSSMQMGIPGEFLESHDEERKLIPVDYCRAGSSLFGNNGKRASSEVEDEEEGDELHPFSPENPQKRPRTETWEQASGFYASMDQGFTWFQRAKMEYTQKEQEVLNAQMQLHCLNELIHQKDQVIENLESSRMEEYQKRQLEIRRFQHEYNLMSSMVLGYQKALQETRQAFAEYRKKFPQGEVPVYKDVGGPGGTVLTVRELERRCREMLEKENQTLKRRELENRTVISMVLQFANTWSSKFERHREYVAALAKRVNGLCEDRKCLKDRIRRATNPGLELGEKNAKSPDLEDGANDVKNSVLEDGIVEDQSSIPEDGSLEEKGSILEDGVDETKNSVGIPA